MSAQGVTQNLTLIHLLELVAALQHLHIKELPHFLSRSCHWYFQHQCKPPHYRHGETPKVQWQQLLPLPAWCHTGRCFHHWLMDQRMTSKQRGLSTLFVCWSDQRNLCLGRFTLIYIGTSSLGGTSKYMTECWLGRGTIQLYFNSIRESLLTAVKQPIVLLSIVYACGHAF